MSTLAMVREKAVHWKDSPVTAELVGVSVSFLVGLLFSRAMTFGKYAPFGVAAVAAAPYHFMWAASAGALMGYLFPSSLLVPVRYLTCVAAAAAIRWTLHDVHRISRNQFMGPMAAFGPMITTGAAMVLLNGSPLTASMMYLAEALFSAGGCWFFQRVWDFSGGKGLYNLTQPDLAGVTMFFCVIALSFSSVSFYGVSLGRIGAIIFILYAGRYGGIAAGAVTGIAAGVTMGLSAVGISPVSGAYALGGLLAGIFSPLGKLASAAAFAVAGMASSLQIGTAANPSGIYEIGIACIVFLLLPAGGRVAAIFSPPGDTLRSSGLRESVVMRLNRASEALSQVSQSVEDISEKLSKLCAPDPQGVYMKAASKTCRHCGLKPYCWEKEYKTTIEALESMTDILRRNGQVEKRDMPEYLQNRCARLPEMVKNINNMYQEYLAREAAEIRAGQVREVAVSQFGITAGLLKDFAMETEEMDHFDHESARRVGEIFRQAGILPLEICCRIDRYNRMTVEAEAARGDRSRLNKGLLSREISQACGHDFGAPLMTITGDRCRMVLNERPLYKISHGAAQHICAGGSLCGDSYSVFADEFGHVIAMISDGMGTGGRAAVDGAMTSGIMESLLKSGISFRCALQLTNAALLARAGDESLATLDVLSLDLHTGEAVFYKAGAPVSFVLHEGKGREVEAPSFPVGILGEAEFAQAQVQLVPGDMIAMVSDGVTACGCDWICTMLEEWPGGDPGELSKRLVQGARERRTDGHDDDITALVAVMEERSAVKKT